MKMRKLLQLAAILLKCEICSTLSTARTGRGSVLLIPSKLECRGLSQSYPVSLMNKLFSSVPKREFAIQGISLSIGTEELGIIANIEMEEDVDVNRNNFILLVGRSASGKTTFLRIASGEEDPLSGEILLNGSQMYPILQRSSSLPKPVMIDSKPDCYDNKYTVMERIKKAAGRRSYNEDFTEYLAEEFASILNLSPEQMRGYPSTLSPSGQYLFGIACACMESTFPEFKSILTDKDEDHKQEQIAIHCPILLLDELLDNETSSVAKNVGKGLQSLAKRGAIVFSATHRPEFLTSFADRKITLSGGKVLLDEMCNT